MCARSTFAKFQVQRFGGGVGIGGKKKKILRDDGGSGACRAGRLGGGCGGGCGCGDVGAAAGVLRRLGLLRVRLQPRLRQRACVCEERRLGARRIGGGVGLVRRLRLREVVRRRLRLRSRAGGDSPSAGNPGGACACQPRGRATERPGSWAGAQKQDT